MEPVALAQALIRCPSVTPADAGALDVLASALGGLGFDCTLLSFGQAPDGPIRNLFATIGSGGPHFAFAGHTDVVPEGAGWSVDPYAGQIRDGLLFGRGAADMKGAIAAMVSAAAAHVARGAPGTLSFLITGDEEGPATHGTDELLRWMESHGHRPDMCLVGEPSSAHDLGDMMKIGRRGSLNAWIAVKGAQGHVAYPDRADNPIRRLLPILTDLQARHLDSGTDWFTPSNLEITDLEVGNPATNVIPAEAKARLNIRFNDSHRGEDLANWIRETVAKHAPSAEVTIRISGEAFLTEPGALSTLIADAVQAETGRTPELSTTGGTSDARFIRRICPVVEFGLPGQSMHKVDELASVADIEALARIYDRLLQSVFAPA
ncbi:succinyl-diaminopimelate desuccinylase [Sandaracinobacter neustonicus]|uniref:Succinyl-diaminopimelate desuccinylase n=1 Tax=Sandaracinobacter neustonicus TaxID=1715348 RepID=A0A501XRD1_9SPHN|nr:succinyl-diaminopimelate desuccinylase [Sandaracinobacter neustonicus]TPE62667.1 succinyl-diaminopimelate desuccinylase [Sandaracinobacter neustonicus]